MARMIKKSDNNLGQKRPCWDTPPTSDDEDSLPSPPPIHTHPQHPQMHTLASAVSILEKSMKEQQKNRVQERAPPPTPSFPVGMFPGLDPNVLRMIYDLGYEAGMAKRDPKEPCETCELRKEKNRIAAQNQRLRIKEEQKRMENGTF